MRTAQVTWDSQNSRAGAKEMVCLYMFVCVYVYVDMCISVFMYVYICVYVYPIEKPKINFNYFLSWWCSSNPRLGKCCSMELYHRFPESLKELEGKKSGMLTHTFNFSTLETSSKSVWSVTWWVPFFGLKTAEAGRLCPKVLWWIVYLWPYSKSC